MKEAEKVQILRELIKTEAWSILKEDALHLKRNHELHQRLNITNPQLLAYSTGFMEALDTIIERQERLVQKYEKPMILQKAEDMIETIQTKMKDAFDNF